MKKILAFLMAMTTCFCAFTACGDTDDSDNGSKKGKSSSSEMDDKDSDDDGKDDKKSDKKSSKIEYDDSDFDDKEAAVYKKAFQRIIDSAADGDIEEILWSTLPDLTMKAIDATESMDAIKDAVGSFSTMEYASIKSVDVADISECDAATVEKLEKLYSVYSNMFLIMEKQGITYNDIMNGSFDADNAMDILNAANQLTQISSFDSMDVDISVEIADARFVTFEYNGVSEKTVAYKVKGEDWKIDTIGIEIIGY